MMSSASQNGRVFVVAPCFNEEEGLARFAAEVRTHTSGLDASLLLVDDGSTDRTAAVAEELVRASVGGPLKIELIRLSRNFGHQAAIQAGLEAAFEQATERDHFLVMDADLQHPPEWIPKIVQALRQGVSHVQMLREDDARTSLWKRVTSRAYYRIFSALSGMRLDPGGADFRGMNHAFLRAYLELRERGRFNRALFHWVGFPTLSIPYAPAQRFAGQSKYSALAMFRLGFRGITYFSSRPLIFVLTSTVAASLLLCLTYFGYEIWRYSQGIAFVVGWPSVIFFVSFWGGLLAFGQLLLALYLSRIFDEAKARPIYVRADARRPDLSLEQTP